MVACVLCLAACKKLQEKTADRILEKTIERQTGAEASVDLASRSLKLKAKEGQLTFTAGEAELPKDFPKDIFVDKESKIEMSLKSDKGESVIFDSPKDITSTLSSYKAKMKENGWSGGGETNVSGAGSITFKKKNRRVSLMLFGSGNRTKINLMYQ